MDAAADRELLQRCRDGSEAAFRQLIDAYQVPVFAAVRRAGVPPADVDARAQEVFLRIYRGLPYTRAEAGLSEWIQKVVASVGVAAWDIHAPAAAAQVPPGFAERVTRATRRDWLRAEERFDWWFNAGITTAIVVTAIGLVLAISRTGLGGVLLEFGRQLGIGN
jgi:DNA-directed RNA polymerase specialized sigma24 family protein